MNKSVSFGLQKINCSDLCASSIPSDILVEIFLLQVCSVLMSVGRITANAGQ